MGWGSRGGQERGQNRREEMRGKVGEKRREVTCVEGGKGRKERGRGKENKRKGQEARKREKRGRTGAKRRNRE